LTKSEEDKYIAEVARLSQSSLNIASTLIATQISMILRDLALKKESNTFIGKIKFVDGELILTDTSSIKQYLNLEFITSKLMEEIIEN